MKGKNMMNKAHKGNNAKNDAYRKNYVKIFRKTKEKKSAGNSNK